MFLTLNTYLHKTCTVFSVASYQIFRIRNIQDLSVDIYKNKYSIVVQRNKKEK